MPKLSPKQRALEAVARFKANLEPKHVYLRAIVGDGAGNVVVAGRSHFYWIRISGRQEHIAQAYCDAFIPAHGMHVVVEELQRSGQSWYNITGRADSQGWFTEDGNVVDAGSNAPPHHWAHEEHGQDMVNVSPYMIRPLRAVPTSPASMALYVEWGEVCFGRTTFQWPLDGSAGDESSVFTAPTWGNRYDLLSLDSDGDLNITVGVSAWGTPARPDCPTGELPICYVWLSSGDTTIPVNRIYDSRPIFSVGIVGDTGPAGADAHIHTYNEDLSLECDGAKDTFITANQFAQNSLCVFHNGHLVRPDFDFQEVWPYDTFEWLVTVPTAGDTLTVEYHPELI